MPELEPSLHALAEAYGIATDYWDWQGRHIEVARETVVAVLAALDVDAATPEAAAAALAEQQRRPWTRMLPPLLALREHRTASIEMHVTHGDPAETWIELETGGHRGPLRQLENWNPPQEVDGGWVGEASFEIPGDLPLGYHTLHARSQRSNGDDAADHHPGVARTAGPDGGASRLGAGRAAVQRPVTAVLGRGGPHRPGGPGRLVRRHPRCGLRPGQPTARGRAAAADGALALPAHQPPLRQPDLPPAGADPRVRAARRPSAWPDQPAPGRAQGPAGPGHRDRPEPVLGGQAPGAGGHLRGAAHPGPGGVLHGVPVARGSRADRLQHLGGARGGTRSAVRRLADRAPGPELAGRGRLRGRARRPDRLPRLAAVAAGRAAGLRTPGRPPGRDGARHHARPRRRGQPARRGRLGPAEAPTRAGSPSVRRRTRTTRTGRTGASRRGGPTGWRRPRTRPSGRWSPRSSGMPAGSGWTT